MSRSKILISKVIAFATIQVLANGVLFGQAHPRSASEIIKEIDSQPLEQPIYVSCGTGVVEAKVQRERERKLVEMGANALPEIKQALASIQADGPASPRHPQSLYWLALADATIEGPKAYRVLRRMLDDPRFEGRRQNLTDAIALALNLTHYVDQAAKPLLWSMCQRAEPGYSLASLICAWETGDRELLNSFVEPASRDGDSRPDVWLLNHDSTKTLAMGFRLNVRGTWSLPGDRLEEWSGPDFMSDPKAVIETQFSDRAGRTCGTMQIEFELAGTRWPDQRYVVNIASLADLFKIIASCTSTQN
jgi:hypothetical protein